MQTTGTVALAKARQTPRRSDRIAVVAKARCRTSSWLVSDALVENISEDGCCIATRRVLEVGQEVSIRPTADKQIAGVVRWCRSKRVGIEFANKLDQAELAELISRAAGTG